LVSRAAPLLPLLWSALIAAPVRAQEAPGAGRLFGTEEAPPPGMPPSRERVVMRLDYTAAEGCPDEQLVRAAIGAQVRRWDPFAPNAPWRLKVTIVRRAGYEGTAELRNVTGSVEWARPLAAQARCFDLVEDLAVMLALHIDPPSPPRSQAPVKPAQPTPQDREQSRPQALSLPPLPASPPRPRPALRVGVGTWMNLATAPRPAFGVTADLGVRVAWFSVAGELRWDAPAGASTMEGLDVSTGLLTGAIVPCGHVGWFVGCLVGELGQIRGTLTTASDVTPDHRAMLYGTLGARLGFEIPVVADHLYVRLAANLLGVPKRPRFWFDPAQGPSQMAWESPAFTGGLGAGVVTSF
jgi:hypothetical protein